MLAKERKKNDIIFDQPVFMLDSCVCCKSRSAPQNRYVSQSACDLKPVCFSRHRQAGRSFASTQNHTSEKYVAKHLNRPHSLYDIHSFLIIEVEKSKALVQAVVQFFLHFKLISPSLSKSKGVKGHITALGGKIDRLWIEKTKCNFEWQKENSELKQW